MTSCKRFAGFLAILLIVLAAYGYGMRISSGQEGTPAATPAASLAGTPLGGDGPMGEADGVEIFTVKGGHTTGVVDYDQSPPVGGVHNPAWQNCGFYDVPVGNENAVHSLEHGAIWITYQPDLPPVQVDALRQLTLLNDRLVVSPYPGLDAPIVLSTWDRQLRLGSVDDPRLFAFIDAYTDQSPEPGASCHGGVGTPG